MRRKVLVLAMILTFVVSVAGCQVPIPATAIPSAAQPTEVPAAPTAAPAEVEPFVIAVAGPMTGDGADEGQYAMIGAGIARDEINANGGINGRPIELLAMDDKGDPAEAATVAQRLVDDKRVQVVIGHMWSSATLASEPIYVKAGMPVLTPTSSNYRVTHQGWQNIIRFCLNDSIQGPQMAALLVNNLKAKKVAVFYSNDDYGRGVLDESKKVMEELGSAVVYEAPYKPNIDKDFTVQLEAAMNSGAEAALLGSQQAEGGLIVSQASQAGVFDEIPWFVGNAGMLTQLFLDRVDATAEPHILIAAPFDPFSDRQVTKDFVAAFEAIKGVMPSETAAANYDVLYIIAEAYEAGATRDTLIDKIKTMTFTDLVSTESATFDENGDRDREGMIAIAVKDGKYVSSGIKIDLTGVEFEAPE